MGLVLLCVGLPPVVTGPLLGRVLDRWPRRRVMVADNLARAALVAAIPTLHWLGRLDLPLLYGLTLAAGALVPAMATLALGGLVWAPYVTLESSLLQRVVPASALGRVFGVRRALTAAAMPLGAAAAGGLLLERATPTAVIGLSAVTCLLAGGAALCSPALHRLPARRA